MKHLQNNKISKTATLKKAKSDPVCSGRISLTKFFRMKSFAPGAMQKCAHELIPLLGITEEALTFTAHFEHGGGVSQTRTLSIQELGAVMSIGKSPSSLEFCTLHPQHEYIYIAIREQQDKICVSVACSDALLCNALIGVFTNNLGLEEVEWPGQSKNRPSPSSVVEEPSHAPPCHGSPPSNTVCSARPSPLALPEKVTLGWLWQHAPLAMWFWLIGLVAGAFLIGMRAGQIASIRQLFGQ